MKASQLKILDTSNLNNVKFKGSDTVYYKDFPYKAKLIDNNILYNVQRFSEISTFIKDTNLNTEGTIKIRHSYTRNMYFTRLEDLELFCQFFSDQIDYVGGPLSKIHVNHLLKKIKNSDRKHTYEIRKQKYFKEYDYRLMFLVPVRPHKGFVLGSTWSERISKRLSAIHDAKDAVENCRQLHNNIYISKDDYDEIKFFTKLKYPEVDIYCTEALVEPLL